MSKITFQNRIHQFQFSYDDVMVSQNELIHSVGYSDENFPHHLSEFVDRSLEVTRDHAHPRGGFVLLADKKISVRPDHLYIDGVCFKSGRIITRHFRNVEFFAVLLATIGSESENISKQAMSENDLLAGYFVDAASTCVVENTADAVERELQSTIEAEGLRATNRYSPGYCGWNVEDQHKLFSFFPTEFCGVVLNESAMMIPMKSVSALIGIGEKVQKEEYECEICDAEFCYRRDREKRRQPVI